MRGEKKPSRRFRIEAANVKQVREQLGMSQWGLAQLTGDEIGEYRGCGEKFYTPDTVRRMKTLEEYLRQDNVMGWQGLWDVS